MSIREDVRQLTEQRGPDLRFKKIAGNPLLDEFRDTSQTRGQNRESSGGCLQNYHRTIVLDRREDEQRGLAHGVAKFFSIAGSDHLDPGVL